jgi:hypothetical protein
MPYELEKVINGYYVITQGTGFRHSKRPLSLTRAKAQMRALYANMPESEKRAMRSARRSKNRSNRQYTSRSASRSLKRSANRSRYRSRR